MKKLIFLGFAFSIIFMQSCTKEYEIKKQVPDILKAGHEWNAQFNGPFFTGSSKLIFLDGNKIKVDGNSGPYRWVKLDEDNIRLYKAIGKPQLNTAFGINMDGYDNDLSFFYGANAYGSVFLGNNTYGILIQLY